MVFDGALSELHLLHSCGGRLPLQYLDSSNSLTFELLVLVCFVTFPRDNSRNL